ncbi:MAG: helix-turn-helix domain-containing protein [Blastocatellia bacterium]|nr:helix-turn-helix domain-containing protein [Blastocatellia bacterium]
MIRIAEKINPQKYGRLLSKTLPTIIKSEEENDRAILIVEKLLATEKKLSSEETVLLELLGRLITDFEENFYQPRNASPHEILIEMMNARGFKQKDLAEVFGSKSRVSEAISGKREISKSQAKALADFFKVSAELFI